MAIVTVRFQCGCIDAVDVDQTTSPQCATHQARALGVVKAPAPTFVGHVRGPLGVPRALEAIPVHVASKPLRLKSPDPQEAA